MANCLLNADYSSAQACGMSLKKVVNVYLANYGDVTASAIEQTESGGTKVTGFTFATGKGFYKMEPAENSPSFVDQYNRSDNGAKYRVHTVNFSLDGEYDGLMADRVDTIANGKFIAVLELSTGEFIIFGRVTGLRATTDGGNVQGFGSAADAAYPYVFVLTSEVTEICLPLSDAAIAEVKTRG
jgi:hypothetical protein